MKTILPHEIELYYIIPSIRKQIALIMVKRGISQKEVSKKLHITESAVSQYIKNKRASKIVFDSKTKKLIESSTSHIIKGSHVITELNHIAKELRNNMTICKIHHSYDKSIPKNCNLCMIK